MSAETRCILDPFNKTCPPDCRLYEQAVQFTEELEKEYGPDLDGAGIGIQIDIRNKAARLLIEKGRLEDCEDPSRALIKRKP